MPQQYYLLDILVFICCTKPYFGHVCNKLSRLPKNQREWRTGRNSIPLVKRTTWSVFCKTGKKFNFGSLLTSAEIIDKMTFNSSLSIVFHLFDWKNHPRTCYFYLLYKALFRSAISLAFKLDFFATQWFTSSASHACLEQ